MPCIDCWLSTWCSSLPSTLTLTQSNRSTQEIVIGKHQWPKVVTYIKPQLITQHHLMCTTTQKLVTRSLQPQWAFFFFCPWHHSFTQKAHYYNVIPKTFYYKDNYTGQWDKHCKHSHFVGKLGVWGEGDLECHFGSARGKIWVNFYFYTSLSNSDETIFPW